MTLQSWKRRAMVRTEEGFYPAVEGLFYLHRLSYWHNVVAMRSDPGWPDYTVFGKGWHAWVELKARSLTTGRIGKLSVAQRRYKQDIEDAGGEYVVFLLPDDWSALECWLTERTGIVASHSGSPPEPVRIPRRKAEAS